MNFIYIHTKKSQSVNIVTKFLNIIRTRYERVIHYFRTNNKISLDCKYNELTVDKDIIIECSVLIT